MTLVVGIKSEQKDQNIHLIAFTSESIRVMCTVYHKTHRFLLKGDFGISATGIICSPGLTHIIGPSSLSVGLMLLRLESVPHGRVRCSQTDKKTIMRRGNSRQPAFSSTPAQRKSHVQKMLASQRLSLVLKMLQGLSNQIQSHCFGSVRGRDGGWSFHDSPPHCVQEI